MLYLVLTYAFPFNFLVCTIELMKVKCAYEILHFIIQDQPMCSAYGFCYLCSNTIFNPFPFCPPHKLETARATFWLPWTCFRGPDSLAFQV